MTQPRRYSQQSLLHRVQWAELDLQYLRQLIRLAKIEDLAAAGLNERPTLLGDVTTALMPEKTLGRAELNARESMVVCGLPLIPEVLAAYHSECNFEPQAEDGQSVSAGTCIGVLEGPATALLQAERVLLNFVQHLSGIATDTQLYANHLSQSSTALLDTRKTLPGYRVLQKYAFACGGGYNHRIGLFDRVMLKDNHLEVAGATGGNRLAETVALARATCEDLPIEVEIDRLDQIEPVLTAGADILLLDNFSLSDLKTAIETIGDQALTEASGGITQNSLPELALLGLDFISTGAPVHQSTWKDIGLDWL